MGEGRYSDANQHSLFASEAATEHCEADLLAATANLGRAIKYAGHFCDLGTIQNMIEDIRDQITNVIAEVRSEKESIQIELSTRERPMR